jgi:hypothetical protein
VTWCCDMMTSVGGEATPGSFIAVEGGSRTGLGGRWWCCGFNSSVSAREGRRLNKALPKDEPEAVNSSWLQRKEA